MPNKTIDKIDELLKVISKGWELNSVNDININESSITLYISSMKKNVCMGICYFEQLFNIVNVIIQEGITTDEAFDHFIKNISTYKHGDNPDNLILSGFIYLFTKKTGQEGINLINNTDHKVNVSMFIIYKEMINGAYLARPFITLDKNILSDETVSERVQSVIKYDLERNPEYYD